MGERCEITARPHRATARHLGQEVVVEERQQLVDEQRAHPRVPLGQRIRPQQQHAAHGGVRERLPHTGGVRQDQALLQRLEVGVGDADVGEVSEAGVDPVDGLSRSHRTLDHRPRRRDALPRRSRQDDMLPAGSDRGELLQRQRPTGQLDQPLLRTPAGLLRPLRASSLLAVGVSWDLTRPDGARRNGVARDARRVRTQWRGSPPAPNRAASRPTVGSRRGAVEGPTGSRRIPRHG